MVMMVNLIGNLMTSDQVLEPIFRKKLNDWIDQGLSNDLLFIGSSRTYRQINPEVIDSVFARTAMNKSFNLGMPSTFVPETYFVLEVILEEIRQNKLPVKTIVLELQAPDAISISNATTLKGNYWLDAAHSWTAIKLALGSKESILKRILMALTYLEASAFKHFGFNYLAAVNPKMISGHPYTSGYLCLDDQLALSLEVEELTERKVQLQNEPNGLEKRKLKRAALDSLVSLSTAHNKAHLALINKMKEACSAQNIKLLFVLMPKQSEYMEQLPLAIQLQNDCIDLSAPTEYPEFWQPEYAFDIGHLNCDGANLLSKKLAIRLREIE